MKQSTKLLAMILSLFLLLAGVIPTLAVSAADADDKAPLILGDADSDGTVTVIDATRIQKYLASLLTLTPDQMKAADADLDGSVTVLDATIIQKWLASLEVSTPIGQPIEETAPTEAGTEAVTEAPTEAATTAPTEAEVTGDEWKENTGTILLSDSGITVTGTGACVDGNTVIITEGGDWEVTGSCSDGMIYVRTCSDEER